MVPDWRGGGGKFSGQWRLVMLSVGGGGRSSSSKSLVYPDNRDGTESFEGFRSQHKTMIQSLWFAYHQLKKLIIKNHSHKKLRLDN